MHDNPAIIVFSHLRWDFVFQRPQQLLSRLAANHRVYFLEEPIHHDEGYLSWDRAEPLVNLTVCRPRMRVTASGFADPHIPALRDLLAQLVAEEELRDYVVWFYTPMALPLLAELAPRAVVYDCMDELSAFLHAPPRMREREAGLLARADVVFTGGRSLYLARKHRHANVHCFPSSVDQSHFARASSAREAADQAALPGPRLGFFGVLDERMDLALIDALACARPDFQLVMVGPVAKIDPVRLPRRPNLHYFGQRDYDELPSYLAGWDVCLLPFARTDATRYLSPTKTLEYMAAGKPIVGTSLPDVAGPYGDIVYLADTPEQLVAACARAMAEQPDERARRLGRMREVLAATSWDRTAVAMAQEIARVIDRKSGNAPSGQRARRVAPERARRSAGSAAGSRPCVIIGAGPTGLSAAYHLGADALLLEQNQRIGGWCRSIEDNGFTFDYAGHIMFSNDPYVHELYGRLLGENVHWQDREAWIYSKNTYTRYPFQGALYGLPADVIKECVIGAIEARFGSVRGQPAGGGQRAGGAPPGGNGSRASDAHCKAESITDCCADGVMESTAALAEPGARGEARAPRNFEEFIYRVWGAGIAKHFAIPYNRKLWAVPLSEMDTSWLGGRVPLPDLEEMIEGALRPVPRPMGPNARFGYPLRGGFQALMDGFLPYVKDALRTGCQITAVSPGRRTVTIDGEEEIPYRHLISTMPLPVLIRIMGDEAPARVQQAAKKLRYVSVRCVNIGVGRERLTEKHWIYYPEQTVFHRIFVQGNASPHCNPPGGFGLTCEITYSEHKPLPCEGDALIQRCIRDCHEVGLFGPEDPVWAATQVDLPHAYVVYDHARSRNVAVIRDWLATQHIVLAGRYSEWEYYNSDHAFLAGKKAADTVRRALSQERMAAPAAPGEAVRASNLPEPRPGRSALA